jgi:acetyl-CoA/propionyl-CoA carboxylase biotin carboxyl carrier protein
METVFIPNRGEVIRRVARTARRMGLRVTVGYSDADASDPFLAEVDQTSRLGPAPASGSYLSIPEVIRAARECRADLVHPGYGFLAENAAFASAVESEGMRFVGPSPETLKRVASKSQLPGIATRLGIPTIPGYGGAQSDEAFAYAARTLGYPVIVKTAAGGGGKGIVRVDRESTLPDALGTARRVAAAAFGSAELILERYITGARHIEVQIVRDASGTCTVLGDRDCSAQRRYQKIMEESPASGVNEVIRRQLYADAVRLADEVGYLNVGTVEFIVGDTDHYFLLEVNPRLQVEHPVTELVWGIDLVEQQLCIALGGRATVAPTGRGHAIEARITAEDPHEGFRPGSGRIEHLRWPAGIRVDAGYEEGATVSPFYDSLLGKVIAYGPDRPAALARLDSALRETSVLGIPTTLPLLRSLVRHDRVLSGTVTTDLVERSLHEIIPTQVSSDGATALAAAIAAQSRRGSPTFLHDNQTGLSGGHCR